MFTMRHIHIKLRQCLMGNGSVFYADGHAHRSESRSVSLSIAGAQIKIVNLMLSGCAVFVFSPLKPASPYNLHDAARLLEYAYT